MFPMDPIAYNTHRRMAANIVLGKRAAQLTLKVTGKTKPVKKTKSENDKRN